MKKNKEMNFTHVDINGLACMVDIGEKLLQRRYACAQGKILLSPLTIQLIQYNQIKKGDVINVARIAGIQAAKLTPQLIPLCHSIILNNIEIDCKIQKDGIMVTSKIYCIARTGVEMEALTATNITLLTIYDMCKSVDKTMVISDISLIEKKKSIFMPQD